MSEDLMEDEITPAQVKAKLDAGENFTLVDVRESHERDICIIEGAIHIPLGEVESRAGELDPSAEIVLHCKMGGRSAQAQDILRGQRV